MFVPYSDFEKEQLSLKYGQKKRFAKVKDLDSRYERIYNEKTEQYWRFAQCDVEEEADDSHAEESESSEEEEGDAKPEEAKEGNELEPGK